MNTMSGDRTINQGDTVKYRMGNSQEPNAEGTVTHIDGFTVYIDGVPGRKSGIPRSFAEVALAIV